MSSTHKQVPLFNPINQKHINIDLNIAELILNLWQLGINTILSCEDNFDTVWIQFSYDDAKRFLNFLVKQRDNHPELFSNIISEEFWKYSTNIIDRSEIYDKQKDEISRNTRSTIDFEIGIRFPKEDYYIVLNILKREKVVF